MPLQSPNLDDRNFAQLVEEAKARIRATAPEWTDMSASDPGIVLLELFAYLTESLIYRLNRLPDKAYTEFLNLIGVQLYPPAASRVTLVFSRARAGEAVEIPRGTRVTVSRAASGEEPPVFSTVQAATLPAGDTSIEVTAYNCDLVIAEQADQGSGRPGQQIAAKRPPLIAPTGDELDLVLGVEAEAGELGERVPAIRHETKTYRVWREVSRFANLGDDRHAYVVDRVTGTISFGPSAHPEPEGTDSEALPSSPLAEVPLAGREIRLWYRRGGGASGNVPAGALTTLKDPIAGLEVTNPEPAVGGREAETLENALVRGPQSLFRLERAVTGRDYEMLALAASRAVMRARAFTTSVIWAHANPGTVELLLVPHLPENQRPGGRVTAEALKEQEVEEVRAQIESLLDVRHPLGATLRVNWARYKTVRVGARIVVRREEDIAALRQRVVERLQLTINPLPTRFNAAGWSFGQALRASNVYEIALWEPGVRWVDNVRLLVEKVPDSGVESIAADAFQADTWFAGSAETLFRSLNDGAGWEPAGEFPGEKIEVVRTHPDRAGFIAAVTRLPDDGGTQLHISRDCGETWEASSRGLAVYDVAWALRDGNPILYIAADNGLYELSMTPESSPVQALVDESDQTRGFYAVTAFNDSEGDLTVAVASTETGGVYLSSSGGRVPYRNIGLSGQDIRVLAVQHDNVRRHLWAGAAAPGGDAPGSGCFHIEVTRAREVTSQSSWNARGQGWSGGSCRAIGFVGRMLYAASHHAGVLRLDSSSATPAWEPPEVTCGLPLRDRAQFLFQPVDTVAATGDLIMAGGLEGVFTSRNGGATYERASSKEYREAVTLPNTWLFCSGEHEINVVSEDEVRQDEERGN
ncbi:MAG: putative baseplate assembly protein [Dehalococcoidia bacterium]|nr:putative baseplate assembly protein [Dehalococcoidia bacterium]